MKARVEAGTDVAKIGAWDASRNEAVAAKHWGKEWDSILEEDTARGDLFLIYTGADGGGPVDVYCDAEVPLDAQAHTRLITGEFLIRVPTGRLVVGGVEDYRSDKPQITSEESIVQIPGGNYSLRCFVANDSEGESGLGISYASEMKKALTSDDYRYSQRMTNRGLLTYLTLLLYPIIAIPFNWMIALPTTLVALMGAVYIHEQALKRDARYQHIKKIENEAFRRVRQNEAPAMIFELRRLEEATNLKGGSVWLPLEG